MSRYIDVEVLKAHCDDMSNTAWNRKVAPVSWAAAYEDFKDELDDAPSIEIVRCAECMHIIEGEKTFVCAVHDFETEADDFCNFGQRRTE